MSIENRARSLQASERLGTPRNCRANTFGRSAWVSRRSVCVQARASSSSGSRPEQGREGLSVQTMASRAIVGEKLGMTQVWDEEHRVIPVTVLRVSPVRIVQVKTPERDGYSAIQVTWGRASGRTRTKPVQGHFAKAGVEPGKRLVELRLDDVSDLSVGQELGVDILQEVRKVDVSAVSKGKGFAGGMKRHNFRGQGASHGNHKKHRAPGSVGACATPARVFKGTKMAGRLGAERVTTLNLEVVRADSERDLLLVRGAVPGPRGGVVVVREAVKGGAK